MHAPREAARSDGVDAAQDVSDLARHAGDYLHAWSDLFSGEVQFARICANRLLGGVLCVCFLLCGIAITANLALIALLQHWLHDWAGAALLTLLLDVIALFAMLLAMRAWWLNLSLPRSRRALRQLMQRLHATHHASASE